MASENASSFESTMKSIFDSHQFSSESMTASEFDSNHFPDESTTASSFENDTLFDEGIIASGTDLDPLFDEGMIATSSEIDFLFDESMMASGSETDPFSDEGMMASSSEIDFLFDEGMIAPSSEIDPVFNEGTMASSAGLDVTSQMNMATSSLNPQTDNATEFWEAGLQQQIRTPTINTTMAPMGSYFAANVSEYMTPCFLGYDGADAAIAPSAYYQMDDLLKDLQRTSSGRTDPQFVINAAAPQAEWNNMVGLDYQNAAMAPPQNHYGDPYNTMPPAQNQFDNNAYNTLAGPSYQHQVVVDSYIPRPSYPNGVHFNLYPRETLPYQDDVVLDNHMPPPPYQYGNNSFYPRGTPTCHPATAVDNMGPVPHQYDHTMKAAQHQFGGNTVTPPSSQHNAVVDNYVPRPSCPSGTSFLNSLAAPLYQPTAIVNNINMGPAPYQHHNTMTPSPIQLVTPRLSNSPASKSRSGSGVNVARRPGLDHVVPYVPAKVTKGKPGRPKGSKTKKAQYDDNGHQIFDFAENNAVGGEFRSSGNRLVQSRFENGTLVQGAPKLRTGLAIYMKPEDEQPAER